MDAFITRRGGAGGGLDFKIVGGMTKPSSPKENTIWVNTGAEITGYYFSVSEPENMTDGEVWIRTGDDAFVEFSATKDNLVMVYPISAQQCVSGSLKPVPASIYQGGLWTPFWNGILYDQGDEHVDVTGGWEKYVKHNNSEAFVKNAGNMQVRGCTVGIANPVRLKGKTKVCASIYTNSSSAGTRFAIADAKTGTTSEFLASVAIPLGSDYKNATIPLTGDWNGEYYVLVHNAFMQDSTYVNKVWVE